MAVFPVRLAYNGPMAIEYLSSEEMIRRAKKKLLLAKEDFLPQVDSDLSDMGMAIGGVNFSMADEMVDEMPEEMPTPAMSDRMRVNQMTAQATRDTSRDRRVASSTPDHLVVTPRSEPSYSAPAPARPVNTGALTGSGRWMRVVGNLLVLFVAVMWGLLFIGLLDGPRDIGETVGGGVVITLVPLLFGLVLRRAGKRRGTAV